MDVRRRARCAKLDSAVSTRPWLPYEDAADTAIAQLGRRRAAFVAALLTCRYDRVEDTVSRVRRVSYTLSWDDSGVGCEAAGRLFGWPVTRRGIAIDDGDESRAQNGLLESGAIRCSACTGRGGDRFDMDASGCAGATVEVLLLSSILPKEAVERAVRICELLCPRGIWMDPPGARTLDRAWVEMYACANCGRNTTGVPCLRTAPTCQPGPCLCRGA